MIQRSDNRDKLLNMEPMLGKIMQVYTDNPDEASKKYLLCRVKMARGGELKDVPLYGPGIDLQTNKPHGFSAPPRFGQLVLVLFVNNQFNNPVAAIPLPYAAEVSDLSKYMTLYPNVNDVAAYHYSGSSFKLTASGKVQLTSSDTQTLKDILLDIQALLQNILTMTSWLGNLGAPLVYTVPTDATKVTGLLTKINRLLE